jgi:cobalt-zinc-cadmium efflux system outer membrane protein
MPGRLYAQHQEEVLSITLAESESLFYKNNIQLISQRFSIDSAKANVITARLIDNPQIGLNTGLYEPETKKFFDFGKSTGEVSFQISQLIKTAGKRVKNIAVMETGVNITEYQYYDLIRSLLQTLRTDFFNLYYLQQTQDVYDLEINSLAETAKAFEEQVKNGNVAEKDLVRIRSQLYSLQAELANLQTTMQNVMSEFKLLIRARPEVLVRAQVVSDPSLKNEIRNITYGQLTDSIYANRYDLKAANAQLVQSRQNLAFQKSMAVPDITIGTDYDKLGSYVKNFNSIGIGLSIPLFNRNQGNIRQAKDMIEISGQQLLMKKDQVESQLATAYKNALKAQDVLSGMDAHFPDQLKVMIQNVMENFRKRNISLLEFIDFYDAYKQNVIQINALKFNLVSQLENLNNASGTKFFNK